MVRQQSLLSKLFVLVYGLIIGLFLSKQFIQKSIVKTNSNNLLFLKTLKVASISNKFRFLLFVIIGPFILITIFYIIGQILI
ncbi:hypothetical protein KJB62_10820 [Staphylococcus saprophyticus]|uniref:hypothetical protein n=1 Tax=Staphylococcus saprophyticus TaxID=29385 RepID=UPI001F2FE18E|nr:hypothetical protein [Staphylococcus saprophyticus]MCE5131883.1 hypothetical protein [Staphylococcus saprophyticus]